jgi:hypothetical protein
VRNLPPPLNDGMHFLEEALKEKVRKRGGPQGEGARAWGARAWGWGTKVQQHSMSRAMLCGSSIRVQEPGPGPPGPAPISTTRPNNYSLECLTSTG